MGNHLHKARTALAAAQACIDSIACNDAESYVADALQALAASQEELINHVQALEDQLSYIGRNP